MKEKQVEASGNPGPLSSALQPGRFINNLTVSIEDEPCLHRRRVDVSPRLAQRCGLGGVQVGSDWKPSVSVRSPSASAARPWASEAKLESRGPSGMREKSSCVIPELCPSCPASLADSKTSPPGLCNAVSRSCPAWQCSPRMNPSRIRETVWEILGKDVLVAAVEAGLGPGLRLSLNG